MIRIRDVSYAYPGSERPAVANVTLDVPPGKVLAIVGPNGSGKSTLARLMNGLLVPRSGVVTVDGKDTATASPADVRRLVSLVWQNPDNQLVAGVVEDDVAFGPENLGLDKQEIDRRMGESLERVGMAEMRTISTDMLSAGQKQLVALAGALAIEPRYLMLDEATSRLDPESSRALLDAVLDWTRAKNTGVVMITHLLSEVLRADSLCRMLSGEIVAQGPPASLLREAKFAEDEMLQTPLYDVIYQLERLGLPLQETPTTVSELVEELCR